MGDLALILIIAIILFGVTFVRNAIIWGLIILVVLFIVGVTCNAYENGEADRMERRRVRAIEEEEWHKRQAEKEAKAEAERKAKYAKSWRNWKNWEKKFVAPLDKKKHLPKFIKLLWRWLWRIIRFIVMCFTDLRYFCGMVLVLLWAFTIFMLIDFGAQGVL